MHRKTLRLKVGVSILLIISSLFTFCGDGGKSAKNSINIEGLTILDKDGYWSILSHIYESDYKREKRPDIRLNEIKVKLKTDNTFKFVMEFNDNFIDYKKYYLLINLYPRDDETYKLDLVRKKYGFESFSVKISKTRGKLSATRDIKTNLDNLRAITITVISYDDKGKVKEVVLQNIDLSKLKIIK